VTAFFHWFGKLHRRVYALNGAFGRRFAWIPCLVLTTTGRKSGQARDAVLVYADDPDSDGPARVVVASNGGEDRPPAWLLNIQADPAVHVQVGDQHDDATARVVMPDDADYARLWRLVNSINHNRYDAYQAKTLRPIALVVLERRPR
jgi:deazaflavin-dependent oxidoreductase (nitroreductase family)